MLNNKLVLSLAQSQQLKWITYVFFDIPTISISQKKKLQIFSILNKEIDHQTIVNFSQIRFHNYNTCTCNILLIIGHLKILTLAYQHQHRRQNRQWHPYCKILFLPLEILFEKTEGLCSVLCLVIASVHLCYKCLFPIHPTKGVHWCSRNRLFEFSEALSIAVSQK